MIFDPTAVTPADAGNSAMKAINEALSIVTDDEELTVRWTRARQDLESMLSVQWVQG